MSKLYDVVVIGCGPAGLMAARELKKNKVNFICLDAKKKIGEPLRCGEGIRKKDFVDIFGSTNYKFITNETKDVHVVYYKERQITEPYLVLDKPAFEKWMAKPIKKKIRNNVLCKNLEVDKGSINIETTEGTLQAKLAIIATGPNYTLQKNLNLLGKEQEIIYCYGGIYSNFKLDKTKLYFFLDQKDLGYLWAFPKNNGIVNIGYGGWYKNPKAVFKKLMTQKRFNKLKIKRELGGIVPTSGPIEKTYTKRILVAGTAAGLVYAGAGEGNAFALKSGMIAAKTAVYALRKNKFSERFLKKYETGWKKEIGNRIEAGIIFYEIEKFGAKFGVMEKIFDIISDDDITKLAVSEAPKKAKIAFMIINTFNMLSPKVQKSSLRFKILKNLFKILQKLRIL